jgi:hypothetical protein
MFRSGIKERLRAITQLAGPECSVHLSRQSRYQRLEQAHETWVVRPKSAVRKSGVIIRMLWIGQDRQRQVDRCGARSEAYVHDFVVMIHGKPRIVRGFENLRGLVEHLGARDAERDTLIPPNVAQGLVTKDRPQRFCQRRNRICCAERIAHRPPYARQPPRRQWIPKDARTILLVQLDDSRRCHACRQRARQNPAGAGARYELEPLPESFSGASRLVSEELAQPIEQRRGVKSADSAAVEGQYTKRSNAGHVLIVDTYTCLARMRQAVPRKA